MIDCRSCGSPNDSDAAFCSTCGAAFEHALCLSAEDGHWYAFRVPIRLGQTWSSALGTDGRVWDRNWQFEFVRRENRWYVVPNPHAVNETLLNGKRLEGETALVVGDVLAVGRASKGIAKTPLRVERPDLYPTHASRA